ncbi:disks large homolog 5-like [Mesocricetus auratus]|uniref:Disks large homolog 5-like n=1 Tax=Mesocricetus auratus TaxID=10036 RepID=A0ABM2XLR6_MESAU|nr:disks large homolog 5-like [Mesocricetus auratus]
MLSRFRSLLVRGSGELPETRARQQEAALQTRSKTGRKKWFWQKSKAAVEASSQPTPLTQKQVKKELERLSTELQLMRRQRDELRDRLLFITEGTVDNRPYHKPNPFYEKLKLEHEQVMSELKRLQNEKTGASEKCHELTKETVFYRGLHSRLVMEQTQMTKKVDMQRQENRHLLEDWVLLKRHLEDLRELCKDGEEETSDLQTPEQQELQRLQKILDFLMKQKETVMQEKELVEKLQHHLEMSQMRFKSIQPVLKPATS